MRDREPKHSSRESAKKSHLPEKTRGFVQIAFANGAADALDERRKWLLARYVVEDELTLKEAKIYAGVTSIERTRQLYDSALRIIWEASPAEVQRRFPKEEVIRGKIPSLRIPTHPARHSDPMPAKRTDLKPATHSNLMSARGGAFRRVGGVIS